MRFRFREATGANLVAWACALEARIESVEKETMW